MKKLFMLFDCVVDRLYTYGACFTDNDIEGFLFSYERLARKIKKMKKSLVSKEFERFTQLLIKFGLVKENDKKYL